MHYSPGCSRSDILSIYQRGGLLTLVDIGEYTRTVRREQQVTFAHLIQGKTLSRGVLARLESPVVEQLKLADILTLDQQLGQRGVLFSLFWDAYAFFERLLRRNPSAAEHNMKLISIPVPICWWLQFLNPQDRS
jgi:hypothetical protein